MKLTCVVYPDPNTDTKSRDAQWEVVVERSTAEVRTWKEKLATESEADVCSSFEITSSRPRHVYTLSYIPVP